MDQGSTIVISSSDAYVAPGRKSRKKLIALIAGIVVLVVAVVVTVIIVLVNNISKDGGSSANLQTIFDESAPVPIDFGEGSYGYVSPENGNVLIEANFVFAERFYGNYARVATEDRRGNKYKIIDRKGETVLETDSGDSQAIQYIIDQDIWKVGNAFYDGKMNRITTDGADAEYINYGYIKVNAENDEGQDKVLDKTGKEVFVCTGNPCSVNINSDFNNNGEFYAIVGNADRSKSLVSLQDGKEIMRLEAETSNYISSNGNNLFSVERAGDGAVQQQFLVYKNEIRKEFDTSASVGLLTGRDVVLVTYYVNNSISRSDYYDVKEDATYSAADRSYDGNKPYSFSDLFVAYCEDLSRYGLKRGDNEILPCEYDSITTLPDNVFEYYSNDKKQELTLLYGDDVRLYDSNKKDAVKVFGNSGAISDVQFYENSPFYVVDNTKIYSLTDPNTEGLYIADYVSIECFGNYFVIDGKDVYGLDLKAIKAEAGS